MHAVSRLLRSATDAGGPATVADTLVSEARAFFRVDSAILLTVAELEGRCEIAAMDPPSGAPGVIALTDLPPLADMLAGRRPEQVVTGDDAGELVRRLGAGAATKAVLLLAMRVQERVPHVLVLADGAKHVTVDAEQLEVARAFAAAAGAGLGQLELAADRAEQTARQAALARAARTLSETLDLNRVLVRICEEAAKILDAGYANVFLGNAADGLRFEATYGLSPAVIGAEVKTGEGLVGKVIERDEPMLTNDYQGLPRQVPLPEFRNVRSSLAVPMHWDGELRGALAVGYFEPYLVTHEHLALLEAFGDLAAVACRNASAHAGLVLAARTDALTGCLNHAALHDTLEREIERSRRTGHSTSLAILDLDDFKQVNELHGHLAGDEVLRGVGQALRQSVRTYDVVARYGGDEFAIVAIDADEREAIEVARRAIEGVARAIGRLEYPEEQASATAGVAEWHAGEGPTALIARADRALLYGKQQRGARGTAHAATALPQGYLPEGRERETDRVEDDGGVWSDRAREQTERLRQRTRQLALAGSLVARLATLGDPEEIAEAAVDELNRAFGYFMAAVLRVREDGYIESVAVSGLAFERVGVRRWAQPLSSGLIGRAARERRPVMSGDVRSEPDYRRSPQMVDVRSELAVPIMVGGELWGVVDLEEIRPEAFDEDDARLVQALADQIGLALRGAPPG